jgi:hypothetical protein
MSTTPPSPAHTAEALETAKQTVAAVINLEHSPGWRWYLARVEAELRKVANEILGDLTLTDAHIRDLRVAFDVGRSHLQNLYHDFQTSLQIMKECGQLPNELAHRLTMTPPPAPHPGALETFNPFGSAPVS